MTPETISKAQAALPATRAELAERLALKRGSVDRIAKGLIKHGYAHEWGSQLTDKGTLVPIIHSTGKDPTA